MEFLIASNNQHKLEEIRRILAKHGHTAKSLAEIGLNIEPDENGETFEENALIKAVEVCEASGMPTIADDSGLAVDILDGAPGVFSARFSGVHGDDAANNEKLLSLLENVPMEQRTARFVSAVALVLPNGANMVVEGACEGLVGFGLQGENGFGYDPLFLVGEKSFAQLTAEEKDAISHRGRALEKFSKLLPDFLQQNKQYNREIRLK